MSQVGEEAKKNGRVIPCWHVTPQFSQLRDTERRVVFIYSDNPHDRQAVWQGWLPKLATLPWRDQIGLWSTTADATWQVQWVEEGDQLGVAQPLPSPLVGEQLYARLLEGVPKKKKKKPRHIVVIDTIDAAATLDTFLTALPSSVGLCLVSVANLLMVTEEAWRSCGTVVVVPQHRDELNPSPAACLLVARWPQSVLALQAFEQRCAERTAQLTLMVWVVATQTWYWTALTRAEPPRSPLVEPAADVYTEVTELLDAIAREQPAWADRCAAAIVALRGWLRGMHGHA